MKYNDKYPPPTEEDLVRLPTQRRFLGLHPLLWVVLVVAVIAGVGVYSDIVGFYDFDDHIESEDHGDEAQGNSDAGDREDRRDKRKQDNHD